MKILIKSIIYCQTVPLDHLLMYIVKMLCQTSLASFLMWVSLAIFCFRSKPNENCQFRSASLSLVGNNSLVQELKVMGSCWATCNCNILCPTSCIDISLFMEKTNKLFLSYRTVFELAQSLQDSKTSDFNCSYETLVYKEALNHMSR